MPVVQYLSLIFLMFCPFALFAEDWTQHVIKQADRTFDFQTVAKGSRPEHRFVLKNPFEQVLHFERIESSCACTTPVLEGNRKDLSLQTYEESAIIARFNSDLFTGEKNATITVVIDEPCRATFLLNVRGDIRTDTTIKPESLRLGHIPAEKKQTRTLTVDYRGQNSNWRIIGAESRNEHITAKVTDAQSTVGKRNFTVEVTLDEKTPPGMISDWIFLITNDTFQHRELPVYISATVGTVITVTPPTLFLGDAKADEELPVKNAVLRGTDLFKITKITSSNPLVEVLFEIVPDAPPKVMYLLPVKCQKPEKNGEFIADGKIQSLITVETDCFGLQKEFYVIAKVPQEKEEKKETAEELAP